jgi:hypothetical protein
MNLLEDKQVSTTEDLKQKSIEVCSDCCDDAFKR